MVERSSAATVLVEPEPGGHRFQAVANVAGAAARTGEVVLLTSVGAATSDEAAVFLKDSAITIIECFDEIHPPTALMAEKVAEQCRARTVSTVVVMDADASLKRWFFVAPKAFRGLPVKPRVVFMLTRYPARLRITDRVGVKLRVTKATLVVAARLTGVLSRAAGFAGRDDMAPGWIVKRTRDPEICGSHHRDRDRLREELGLPVDRRLVGIFGVISERKNAPLVLEALEVAGLDDVDLLLAGGIEAPVRAWIEAQPADRRSRIITHDGFLTDEVLDKNVAAVDAIPIALTNNGPSGIMGKALAAEVPVVTAGSVVRARELVATDGGAVADLTPRSIGAAIRQVLERDPSEPRRNTVPRATVEEFNRNLLGIDEAGRPIGRNLRNRR